MILIITELFSFGLRNFRTSRHFELLIQQPAMAYITIHSFPKSKGIKIGPVSNGTSPAWLLLKTC